MVRLPDIGRYVDLSFRFLIKNFKIMDDIKDKTWSNTKLILRTAVLGFVISTLGVVVWVMVASNIAMPWAFLIMTFFLGIYIYYFKGNGWPDRTKLFRLRQFRSLRLSKDQWIWSLVAAAMIVIIEQSGLVVTFRLMEFPNELFLEEYSFLATGPVWRTWLLIIMASVVAGICEEVGYRGYMQVDLEQKFGPIWGISIVSLVFVIIHLHQAWSGPILAHIFIISALFGTLAYASSSLIPTIVAHVIMDIFNFSFWWSDAGGQFNKRPINITGIDLHFIVWVVILPLSLLIFIMSIKKLVISKS